MMLFWDKISYMVQLLLACMIFMAPARKRGHFALRTGILAVCFLLLSYGVNTWAGEPEQGIFLFAYWAFYIVLCVLFVWNGLDAGICQAVYCAVFGCGMQHIAYDVYLLYTFGGREDWLGPLLIYAGIYLLFYRLFALRLPEQGAFEVSRQSLLPIMTIIILIWLLSVLEVSQGPGFQAEIRERIIYRVIDGLCCFYILWMQINQKENLRLHRELEGVKAVWRQQKIQYQVTTDTIDSINRRCHDLKHQIRALREITDEQEKAEFFDEIEQDIMIYDTALKTGNKALDTVLMEKGLYCQTHGIQWSCMADGSRLSFMRPEDIYAMFGNALDNAITAVLELKEPKKRVISVKIIHQNHILVIQVQNYYEGERSFVGGLPLTTRKNRQDHGFGMKSIRYTAEKYNGTITAQAKNGIFMLQILVPIGE